MRASNRFSVTVTALACLSNICLWNFCLSSFAAAQPSDQAIAERVLGPQWKELSRRAGMIFAGTVLSASPLTVTTQTAMTSAATDRVAPGATPGTAPSFQLSFRVDEAIAGVEPGQVLTIHEWAGAWSMHRPMRTGQHILIFLYPPSRLGLTSPVGGSLGQFDLDQAGKHVAHERKPLAPMANGSASVTQLERAIRSAREE